MFTLLILKALFFVLKVEEPNDREINVNSEHQFASSVNGPAMDSHNLKHDPQEFLLFFFEYFYDRVGSSSLAARCSDLDDLMAYYQQDVATKGVFFSTKFVSLPQSQSQAYYVSFRMLDFIARNMEDTTAADKLLYLGIFFGYCKLNFLAKDHPFQPPRDIFAIICDNEKRIPTYSKPHLNAFFIFYYPSVIQTYPQWKSYLEYAVSIDPKLSFIDTYASNYASKDTPADIIKTLLGTLATCVPLANKTVSSLASYLSIRHLITLCCNNAGIRIFKTVLSGSLSFQKFGVPVRGD